MLVNKVDQKITIAVASVTRCGLTLKSRRDRICTVREQVEPRGRDVNSRTLP